MNRKFYILVLLVSFVALSSTAHADLASIETTVNDIKTNLSNVKTNVGTIKTSVTGNISTVADEFKTQVDLLQAKGVLVKETADQLLDWLNSNKDEYLVFAGNQCDNASPCGIFREEMRVFIEEFSYLSDRFPVIEKMGMSDSPRIIRLIDRLPPILIFPMYEVMNRMPDWNKIPEQLANIYDEIGDPEVFSIDFAPPINTLSAEFTQTAVAATTPTGRFCERNASRLDNGIDQVLLNRLQLLVSYLKTTMSIIGEVPPKDQNLEVAGEGGSLPIPNAFKMIVYVVNFVQDAVSTYRDNISICRTIRDQELSRLLTLEIQVASCLQLVDFIMPGTRDDVYNLVANKIEDARNQGISVQQSDRAMALVDSFRADGDWKQAYLKLCDAYSKIGN